jgi:hypothetical protein
MPIVLLVSSHGRASVVQDAPLVVSSFGIVSSFGVVSDIFLFARFDSRLLLLRVLRLSPSLFVVDTILC